MKKIIVVVLAILLIVCIAGVFGGVIAFINDGINATTVYPIIVIYFARTIFSSFTGIK